MSFFSYMRPSALWEHFFLFNPFSLYDAQCQHEELSQGGLAVDWLNLSSESLCLSLCCGGSSGAEVTEHL